MTDKHNSTSQSKEVESCNPGFIPYIFDMSFCAFTYPICLDVYCKEKPVLARYNVH
jgi:hypothetical protein